MENATLEKRWAYYCPECRREITHKDGALWKCDGPGCTYRGQWPHRKEVMELKADNGNKKH